MNNRVRPGGLHGTLYRASVEPVCDERLAAELPDERSLCLSPRRAHDLVSGGNQSWKKVSAYGAGGTGYENPHARVLRTSLLRQGAGRRVQGLSPSLEAHQREPDNTGHQEPSDVPPACGDGVADGGVAINDNRHCNDP